MYPNASSSSIGTLLRLIQEDQNRGIAGLPAASDPNSPIRNTVQQPLLSPEAPGSSRVVSVRPEGVTQQGPQVAPSVVSPQAPTPPAPVAPQAPQVAQSQAPRAPQSGSSGYTAPPIATSITSRPQAAATPLPVRSVLGAATQVQAKALATPSKPSAQKATPQRAGIGTLIASVPKLLQNLIKQSYSVLPQDKFGINARQNLSKALSRIA